MQSKLVEDSLVIVCPRCQLADEDMLEVIGADAIHNVRCEQCAVDYFVITKECLDCGAETMFTAEQEPAPAVVEALMCAQCAQSFVAVEGDASNARSAN